MKNTDIDGLFDIDKWYEWTAKELRKLAKAMHFDHAYPLRLELLARCYDYLDAIIVKNPEERCAFVGEMTNRHYIETGKRLEPLLLERLATWILAADPDEDRDVLTDRQLRRRVNDKEVLFHAPQRNNYAMELDGNRYVKPRPHMDSDENQRTWVRFPSDHVDKRVYNGPLEKYLLSG